MSVEKNVPQIRFEGFSGEWEQSTLGCLVSFYKGKGLPKTSIQDDGVYPCIHYGELFTKYSEVIDLVTRRTNQSDSFFSMHNDVLMPTSDVTPKGLVKSCCVKQNGIVLGGDILVVRPNNQNIIDGSFLSRFIRAREKQVLQNVTGSTVFHLYASSIEGLGIVFPSYAEQTAIGNYFQKLDNLINQQQQKHDKLSNIKQAMLEKMFPKQGASIPEIRFKGFSGEWEEKSVSQLGDVLTGSTPSTQVGTNYSDDGVPWVTPTDISKNVTLTSAKKLSDSGCKAARIVPQNTILVTCIASIGKNTILGIQGSFNQQINGVIPNEKDNAPYFLFTASILWSEKLKRSAASGTMQIVNKTEFSELKTFVPKKAEQTAIGNYFQKLDSLINQHQQQITKLNNIQQACLSKMFV